MTPPRRDYPRYAHLPGAIVTLTDHVREYPLPAPLKAGQRVTVTGCDIGCYFIRTENGLEAEVPLLCVDPVNRK